MYFKQKEKFENFFGKILNFLLKILRKKYFFSIFDKRILSRKIYVFKEYMYMYFKKNLKQYI